MKRVFWAGILLLFSAVCVQGQPVSRARRNAEKIARALYFIESSYIDTVDIDKSVDAMLDKLMSRLDPHSSYIPRDKVESANEPLDGSFEGIGIEFALIADTLVIQSVIAGGPSESVGIRAGDRIVAVDGENIAGIGLTTDGVRSRLRGPKGSRVIVTVQRGDVLQDFVIRRDTIPLNSIDAAYMPEPGVMYVKLSRFAQHSVNEFLEALRTGSDQRPEAIILDLRGNGGGFMHVAVLLADIFLEQGQTIVRTEGNGIERTERADGLGFYKEGAVVVLVDENSASASEILAGALQDWDRAVIVGRRTFGKGLVQQQFQLPDGSQMRLTVARYHTPSGRVVQSPYEAGNRDAYYQQANARFARGESFSRDSIVLADSLCYRTLRLGRPVYGGGGIMPDVFVPYDTTGVNNFLVRVIGSGCLSDYANEYADKHRKSLESKDLDAFLARWEKQGKAAYEGLLAYCAKKGVEAKEGEEEACGALLRTRLKALLARSVLGTTAYWQIIGREEDRELQKALEVVRNWPDVF